MHVAVKKMRAAPQSIVVVAVLCSVKLLRCVTALRGNPLLPYRPCVGPRAERARLFCRGATSFVHT